jgi:hypothetical protein
MSGDDRAKVAGKLVALPRLQNRDWFNEGGKAWLCAEETAGLYFIDGESPQMMKIFEAAWRYRKSVSPALAESYSVIGRIGPNPKMLVRRDRPLTGFLVEAVAVTVGDEAMFVDLSNANGEAAPFAGESAVAEVGDVKLDDDASPAEVMAAFFHALKVGAESIWTGLFATWETVRWRDGKIYYTAWKPPAPARLSSEWIRARRLILDEIYDVRVSEVGEAEILLNGDEFDGAPKVERGQVVVDHIGLFDGEYRAFNNVSTTRVWSLQRRDGGPWRIAGDRGI